MTKRLTRILCLIFVSAILISTISASDIITGTKITTSPGEGTRDIPTCYVEVIVEGDYIEHWESGVMYEITFSPDDDSDRTDVIYNGHNHTGQLTTWQLWDSGGESKRKDITSFYYQRVYYNATAKYSGYLLCSPH